jgi:hypothetical protein
MVPPMAFKIRNPNPTAEEIAAEESSSRRSFDGMAFGFDAAKGEVPLDKATFQLLATPLAEPGSTRMLAKDKDGMLELMLKGDRSLGSDVHKDDWFALATLLAHQGDEPRLRPGVTVEAQGRFGRNVGQNWKPGENSFRGGRAFAIESAVIDLGNGQRMQIGRPLEHSLVQAQAQTTAPVAGADVPSNPAQPVVGDRAAQAADDARVFKGKPIRTVELRLEHSAFSADAHGDWTIGAANERGPVGLRLPADRAAAWKTEQAPAFQAFQEAQAAMKSNPDARGLRVQAQGAFMRHTIESAGVAKERWEFVATSFAFQHAGKTHEVGRPVVAEAAKAPPSNTKKNTRGQER